MRNKIKGIIFDIDGTLTSTNELIYASFNHIAKKYLGRIFSNEEIVSLFGPTEEVILKQLCPDKFEQVCEEYFEFYRSHHYMAKIYPGIPEILEFLKDKNIPLGIFTGKGRRASLITLEETGVKEYFDTIVTGDEVKNHKPSPEGIKIFLDKHTLKPEMVLMIGDAPSDIKAAKEAGVKVASVLWDKYTKTGEVLKLKSDYIFYKVEELNTFLCTHLA